jgi:hypothetical protein
MKFDSNLAWREASSAVTANRDMLWPLAGIFFFLPRLLLSLFMPDPPTGQGVSPQQAIEQMGNFYQQLLPWMIPMVLFQSVGTLAMLTLFTDTRRPTVGEALKLGAKGVFPYILTQLLFSIALALILGVFVGLSVATQSPIAIGLVVIMAGIAAIAAALRMILAAPVIAVEHLYNPIRILQRTWALTRGNTARMLGFLFLIFLVAGIAMLAASAITGALTALTLGKEPARILVATATAAIAAIVAVYLAAVLAAIHRQLAGPSLAAISSTFE